MRSLNFITTLVAPLLMTGCKDETNIVKVEFTGSTNIRKNHFRPKKMIFAKRVEGSSDPKVEQVDCSSVGGTVGNDVSGSSKCYIMRDVSKKLTRRFANFARKILKTYKKIYHMDGKRAGFASRKIGDVRVVEQNEIRIIREGPDVCVEIVDEVTGFVNQENWERVRTDTVSSNTGIIGIDWMPFDNMYFLYDIVDFTESSMMDRRFEDQYSNWFNGKPLEWVMKSSRAFAVSVCQSRLGVTRIEFGGVIFKVAIN